MMLLDRNKTYRIVMLLVLLSFGFSKVQSQPNFGITGFATQNGGTTGGQGGTVVTVNNYNDLKSYAESSLQYIIMVEGTISNGTGGGQIRIENNKSIIGIGDNAFLQGVGLDMSSNNNIIVQNLRITLVGTSNPASINGGDCISISGTSKNIWVDHCEIYSENPDIQTDIDKYDGLIDIKHQTGFITISWCYLHDHHKGCLVGASDEDLYDDRKITYHHNYFNKVKLRIPMYRGSTGHFFNNYIVGAKDASEIRNGTCVRVEKNYYEALHYSIYTPTDAIGNAERIDNIEVSRTSRAYPPSCSANIPYDYSDFLTENTEDVKAFVPQYSGVGVLGQTTGIPPSVSITFPSDGASFDAPANITLNADASDSDGSVSKVEFFQGATSLGTDNSAPYSVTWNNVSAGSYNLTAVATDNEGVSTTSSGVNITVNVEGTTRIIIQENETGFVSVDGTIDYNNDGFTGDGFANSDNASGKGINWEICIPENGNYSLVWRYANGSTDDRTAQLLVDGSVKVSNVSFPSTSAWTTWGNSLAVNVSLSAGTHQIRLEATSATGLANIDYISISGNGPQAGACSTTDVSVTGVSVSPTSSSVNVGATTQLSATVSPSNATNKNVSWSSSNTSIASVSSSGLVTGVAEGSATITVTTEDGGFTATCNVSVTDNTNPTYTLTTSVVGQGSVSPSGGTFDVNEQLTITASPASDWKFLNWSGDASGTLAAIAITMDSDKSLIANFEFIGTGNCDNPVTISLPFSQDGEGEYCWKTSDDISNVNSWGLEMLEVNGVDFTNIWAGIMPPKQDGYYNIKYVGNFGWSHFEVATTKNGRSLTEINPAIEVHCYPNPVGDKLNIQFNRELTETVDVYLFDMTGKMVKSTKAVGSNHSLDMSDLPNGLFTVRISGENLNVLGRVVKK